MTNENCSSGNRCKKVPVQLVSGGRRRGSRSGKRAFDLAEIRKSSVVAVVFTADDDKRWAGRGGGNGRGADSRARRSAWPS